MIRTKLDFLIESKNRQKGHKFKANNDIILDQPWWFEKYYLNKEVLSRINLNNKNISLISRQYQANPSAYALKQVEKSITNNCKLIQDVDNFLNGFKYSPFETALYKNQKLMVGYLQTLLAEEIMTVFNNKQIINNVNNQLDFSTSKQENQIIPKIQQEQDDRKRVFQQVNLKIQNLNVVLRRMNAMVASQGDLVNRIDQNLGNVKSNISKANQQLKKRVQKEQGKGQFSFEGKINKAITIAYIVNIILIVIFVIKHMII